MSWEATGDSWSGGAPGREPGLPSRDSGFDHSGFDHGGPWAEAVPSAALAAALEQAAGPDDLYAGAETDALVGIARQWAAVESWAASGKLAALRAMTREDAEGRPLLRLQRRGPLPPLVESAWGAVPGLLPGRFPRPLAEPAVRLSAQRALHGCCRQAVPAGVHGPGIVLPR